MTAVVLLGILVCLGVPSSSQTSKIAFVSGLDPENDFVQHLCIADPVPDAVPDTLTKGMISLSRNDNMLDCRNPDWSPDGSQIVFIHQHWINPTDIWVINSDGTNPREILNQTEVHGSGKITMSLQGSAFYFPTWLPDGSRIAFHNLGFLDTMSPDGTNIKRTDLRIVNYDWFDDRRIAYQSSNRHLSIWNLEDATSQEIVELELDYAVYDLEVSPDAYRVAFTKANTKSSITWDDREIWIAGIDGSNSHYLADGFSPTWSPDSKRIAFNRKGEEKLFVINADGSNSQVLFDFPAWQPSWSPWLYQPTGIAPVSWGDVKHEQGH